ncbi:MAG: hypothetical protein VBE63_12640 [Lamprobacter sp.]|uniref:hypothetical protein n=1 Tax=Lamprobacter sp. TaxID=3100796 RepID=UPI002B25F611|nr:hypothetical protein [Lamprobacter sp.]MEA3640775.1 hypothetical protein [Lamprobacter sp.]
MTDKPDWLPPLERLSDYNGDWESYLEAIYSYFKQDFVDSNPVFRGRRLGLKRHPLNHGKEATFWHMIQEGAVEEDRTPDLRRCERIRWPRPIIEHDADSRLKVWANQRRGERRICLWLEQESFLVILADRGKYLLPWTAYLVEQPHRQRKLQREYEVYWQNQA